MRPSVALLLLTMAVYAEPECGCAGRGSRRGRIVGGAPLDEHAAPWLASLARGRNAHCGAALISPWHLLTAAHCVDGLSASELKAWMGVHSLTAAGLAMAARSLIARRILDVLGRSIVKVTPHPDFDASTFKNDIAILQLEAPVEISSRVYPICLPLNDGDQYSNRMAAVSGWGRIGEQLEASDVPRKVMVEVWSPEQCLKSGYPKSRLRSSVICAGQRAGGQDACQGDSGGPLTLPGANGEMEVIGIVSWGRGCGRPNLPGVYTRVASFIPFIRGAMEEMCLNLTQL